MKLDIQLFGGRGATSSEGSRSRGTGSGFFGEEKGGFLGENNARYFAGDTVILNGKEYNVIEAKDGRLTLYNGDETLGLKNSQGVKLKERGSAGNSLLARQRVNVMRNADDTTTMNGRRIPMYNKAPKGFIKLEGASTAPKGYDWYSNGKSRFGDEYINILVRQKRRK